MTDEARIVAYVDGELDAEAAARLETEAAGDPTLAAAIDRHRALRRAVSGAWSSVLDEPVPERLTAAAARGPAAGASLHRLRPRPRLEGAPLWAAMAACLAVGIFVGRGVVQPGPLQADAKGALVVRGALAQALTEQGGGAGGAIKIGLSFRTADRRYCRTFESPGDRLAGVACREGDRWTARMVAAYEPPAGPGPDYRMAASAAPPAVLAAVDDLIAGDPLDAKGEAAAKARGWRD